MEFYEIETKYKADDIRLEKFRTHLEDLNPVRKKCISSYDHYFSKGDTFIRYRSGDPPELTMKRKLKSTNNFVRIETNLKLDPRQDPDEQLRTVEKTCELLEFPLNFIVYKNCTIYYFDSYNVVYYIVYDVNLKEIGRFIEIEMFESHPWKSEAEAWTTLQTVERQLVGLGITYQNRIRRSLFEMFKKF